MSKASINQTSHSNGKASPLDFRFAPPSWQTAICLPDDPDKALVGREGQILFDYNYIYARDPLETYPQRFTLWLQLDTLNGLEWISQETHSPKVPVVRTAKCSCQLRVVEEAFVAISPVPGSSERTVVVIASYTNTSSSPAAFQPVLRLHTDLESKVDPAGFVRLSANTCVHSSSGFVSCAWSAVRNTHQAYLPAVKLQPGETHVLTLTVSRGAASPKALDNATGSKLLKQATGWWEALDLPYGIVQLPDEAMQGMIESSIRNIWQARDIDNGQPAFHVGPTIFRSLWIVDAAFIFETVAMLGRGKDARAGLHYLLEHQKPDGSFELISRYWKENGIVLWTALRHAMLMSDSAWLRAHWPALRRVVQAIKHLRAEASRDSSTPNFRLLPDGFGDGGLGKIQPEFTNAHWCLAGLRAAVEAARWLQEWSDAEDWQREFDDMFQVFRAACLRDQRQDYAGNTYVPVVMLNPDEYTPQKAQWSFCHAVHPGQIFAPGDPLVDGQLSMLLDACEQGMVYGTGWMNDGIWTYFASFLAHALLHENRGEQAAGLLHAFAQHAAPTRVWREEVRPQGLGGNDSGDMPHNWASAEFIRLAIHLLQMDLGSELHLLRGFPTRWRVPGATARLNGVRTPFGPLHMELRISDDGSKAHLRMRKLEEMQPSRIVLHLSGLCGSPTLLDLPTGEDIDETIGLTANPATSKCPSPVS